MKIPIATLATIVAALSANALNITVDKLTESELVFRLNNHLAGGNDSISFQSGTRRITIQSFVTSNGDIMTRVLWATPRGVVENTFVQPAWKIHPDGFSGAAFNLLLNSNWYPTGWRYQYRQ